MPRNDLIQLRRDTAANWTSTNPILASGEMGFETDTGKLKIGTGSTAWTALFYVTDASDITGTFSSLAVTEDITRGGVSLPRGIMAFTSSTTPDTAVTTAEEVELGAISFTAVANRYYKITYYEPDIGISGAGANTLQMRIRNGTTTAGTLLQLAYQWVPSSSVDTAGQVVWFGTFTAGTQNIVATAQNAGGVTFQLNRGTGKAAWLVVEDIGADNNNNNNN